MLADKTLTVKTRTHNRLLRTLDLAEPLTPAAGRSLEFAGRPHSAILPVDHDKNPSRKLVQVARRYSAIDHSVIAVAI